jgi:multicomponent Na+:H+ antiporter subunit F
MDGFVMGVSLAIFFLVLLSLYRVAFGPGILNRIVAVNVIGTKTTASILLIGFLFDKVEFFIDIALVYALINFIGTLAFSKYFERKGILHKELGL